MFERRKNEEYFELETELDAAWEDDAPKPYFGGAAAHDESNFGEFSSEDYGSTEFSSEEHNNADYNGESAQDEDAQDEDAQNEDAQNEYAQDNDAWAENAQSEPIEGGIGRHDAGITTKQAKLDQMPEHQKRSRHMRRILRVVIVLLIALLGALGYFGWRLYQESRVVVEQETTDVTTEVEVAAETEELTTDTGSASTKKTTVPNLLNLLGKTQEEALQALGHGATVTLDSEVAEDASPMMHRLTVVLAEEPTDTKSGTPTVYLGMDTEEKVVIAGYSAATASLGYGTLSFSDVVTNQHVVEQTLTEAGLGVADGSVQLPDSSTYSSYADDGTTLIKEQCAFDGQASQGGKDYTWTSVLVYNYTAANATGNLADTVRQVYIYVSDTELANAALEAKTKVLEQQAATRATEEEAARKAEEEAAQAASSSARAEADANAENGETAENAR